MRSLQCIPERNRDGKLDGIFPLGFLAVPLSWYGFVDGLLRAHLEQDASTFREQTQIESHMPVLFSGDDAGQYCR